MAALVDSQIKTWSANGGLILPFNEDQVNPASYDIRLGEELLIETTTGFESVSIKDEIYNLTPGEFVLGVSFEYIKLPNNIEAVFQLKSSRGREGYEHALAGYIDPGYEGRITLELTNLTRFQDLPLYEGLLIGQLRFFPMGREPDRPYSVTGHYHQDTTVQQSKVNALSEWKSGNFYSDSQET